MSVLLAEDAVAAGIGGHLSTDALQDAIDEEEAWLARKLGGGPLDAVERTETFPLSYLPVRSHEVRLSRPADPDAGLLVLSGDTDITDTVELRHGNRRVALVITDGVAYRITGAWAVTYTPGDLLEVKRALKVLLALSIGGVGGLQSEIIGSYSYTRAAGSATKIRRSIVRDLRGEPGAGTMRILSSVRHGLAGVLDR